MKATNSAESKIGSDPSHTAWCRRIAKDAVKDLTKNLGALDILSHSTKEDLLMARMAGVVLGQANEDAPLWRMQELLQVAHQLFNEED
jgi:hypothetical protein